MTKVIRKSVGGKILTNIIEVAAYGVQVEEGKNVEISNLNILSVNGLANADLSKITFKNCEFSNFNRWVLDGATLVGCKFNDVLLNQESISGATFTDCVFVDCEFIDCIFKGCAVSVSRVETNSDDGYGLSLAYSYLHETALSFSGSCNLSIVNLEGVENNE